MNPVYKILLTYLAVLTLFFAVIFLLLWLVEVMAEWQEKRTHIPPIVFKITLFLGIVAAIVMFQIF